MKGGQRIFCQLVHPPDGCGWFRLEAGTSPALLQRWQGPEHVGHPVLPFPGPERGPGGTWLHPPRRLLTPFCAFHGQCQLQGAGANEMVRAFCPNRNSWWPLILLCLGSQATLADTRVSLGALILQGIKNRSCGSPVGRQGRKVPSLE